ncbi:T9SS type A sorting domain-containing protein [Hymenobacter sp. IS2118]|uniref:T9SS type A sorting domain-containing protein n=1 Tax=Hymenobacter sp. IS2118 TaxID=1505605 RepID=UPI000A982921|nr:T9SS type A sorting domain-containing protein [Hymenobacter sp. IS2118]
MPQPLPHAASWPARPGRFRPLTLLLTLALAGPAAAQQLTNTGQTLYVGPDATLSVPGSYSQSGAAILRTAGTARLGGSFGGAAGTTLDLSTGTLEAGGNVQQAGTLSSTPTGTLRLNGAAAQTLDAPGGTVGQLVLDKPGATRVDLPADLTLTGGLTLSSGLLRTAAASTLILADGATLMGEAPGNYVQGNLRATRTAVSGTAPVVFPNSAAINPNGNALGSVSITRTAGLGNSNSAAANPGGSPSSSIDRIWRISVQNQPAAGTPATLTLSWLADDDGGLSTPARRAAAQAFRRDVPGGPFVAVGPSQDATGRSLSVAAAAFSDWTVSAAVAPLPVTLVAFSAERAGEAARLRWTTASETNSAWFEVQASPDGQQFRAVGRVAAAGTTSQRRDYTLLDPNLTRYGAPVVYYRLRQLDLDGTAHFSPVQTVAVPADAAGWQAALWPNPAGSDQLVTLQLRSLETAPLQLRLLDATGRELARRTVPAAAALALPELDGLAPGLYLLHLEQAGHRRALRLVRQ